jgi:hypothetical protein
MLSLNEQGGMKADGAVAIEDSRYEDEDKY